MKSTWRATAHRFVPWLLPALVAVLLFGGLTFGVIRGTGFTDTQVKTGYSLVLLLFSLCTLIGAVKASSFTSFLTNMVVQVVLVILYVALGRYDAYYLSWLMIFPIIFAAVSIYMMFYLFNRELELKEHFKSGRERVGGLGTEV